MSIVKPVFEHYRQSFCYWYTSSKFLFFLVVARSAPVLMEDKDTGSHGGFWTVLAVYGFLITAVIGAIGFIIYRTRR